MRDKLKLEMQKGKNFLKGFAIATVSYFITGVRTELEVYATLVCSLLDVSTSAWTRLFYTQAGLAA